MKSRFASGSKPRFNWSAWRSRPKFELAVLPDCVTGLGASRFGVPKTAWIDGHVGTEGPHGRNVRMANQNYNSGHALSFLSAAWGSALQQPLSWSPQNYWFKRAALSGRP
jgi:hypothetical protein